MQSKNKESGVTPVICGYRVALWLLFAPFDLIKYYVIVNRSTQERICLLYEKMLLIILALLTVVELTACGNGNDKASAKTQLGTSAISIVLPEGFVETEDDFDEDQVAYFYKDDESIDFDVYQWEKGNEYVLEEEAAYFSAEYGTTASEVTVNGIPGMKYISLEEYDGYEYTVINYMFDDGKNIVELCFWTINTEEELATVEEIIKTIAID